MDLPGQGLGKCTLRKNPFCAQRKSPKPSKENQLRAIARKEMLERYVGSRYVHENKQKLDKVSDEKADSSTQSTRILQKNPAW